MTRCYDIHGTCHANLNSTHVFCYTDKWVDGAACLGTGEGSGMAWRPLRKKCKVAEYTGGVRLDRAVRG